jgi:hypothetical protein
LPLAKWTGLAIGETHGKKAPQLRQGMHWSSYSAGRMASAPPVFFIVIAPVMRCLADGQSYGGVLTSCGLSDIRDLAQAMLATRTVLPWI